MKSAYYIRILPRRILALPPEEFFWIVGESERVHWQQIEAWNKYHAKQLGMEYRKALKVLEQ